MNDRRESSPPPSQALESQIRVLHRDPHHQRSWTYALAAGRLVSDRPLSRMANGEPAPRADSRTGEQRDWPPGEILLSSRLDLGGRSMSLKCSASAMGYLLRSGGAPDLRIDADGRTVHCLGDSSAESEILLLGPGIVLALALQGVFCLHGSAAEREGRAVAFLGDTGAGKSTMAARAEEAPDWHRVGDDILPVGVGDSGEPLALPHFPQLALTLSEQYEAGRPSRLPLAAACLLERSDAAEDVRIEQASPMHATLALLSHTVGTRLFALDLSERHLVATAALAERLPLYRLLYSSGIEALPEVLDAVWETMRPRLD